MSAHTPGPWRANRNSAYWEVCAQRHRIEEGVPYSVADVCASDPNNADGGLQEANARLIAAAPELLEALEELLRVDDEWHGSVNSEMASARGKSRAAIAKAKGETQ